MAFRTFLNLVNVNHKTGRDDEAERSSMRTTPWLTLFVHSWCLNHLPIQEMGTKHIQFRINWVSRHTASCWHATGLWPLYAYRRNTTGCFVWMLSTLDLTTLLSGEAWRINSHSMDFPTSPTIHSSHSLRPLFLSCTTCCLISASWLFDLFPLSNGIFIILEKRLSNHPRFLSDSSCAQI